MLPVALDYETRSSVDLVRHGGHRYAAGADTEAVCLVARVPGVEGGGAAAAGAPLYYVWSPLPTVAPLRTTVWPEARLGLQVHLGTEAPPPEFFAECQRRGVVAHNAEGFDRLVWEGLGWPEVRWFDSRPRAARAALPGKLQNLATALGLGGKDDAGAEVMRAFMAPRRVSNGAVDEVLRGLRALKRGVTPRKPIPPALLRALAPNGEADYDALLAAPPYGAEVFFDPDPSQFAAIVRYCARDAWLLAMAWERGRLGEPHVDDPLLELDGVVNRRGVAVDEVLVDRLLAHAEALTVDTVREVLEATGGVVTETTLHSPSALCAWLRKRGYPVLNAQERAIKAAKAQAADRGDTPAAVVCDARLRLARVSTGKLRAIKDRLCPDGRLRGMFAYYGAHTGRWAGRGVQPQNLPRPAEAVTEAVADRLASGESVSRVADDLGLEVPVLIGSLLRSCLVASDGPAGERPYLARVDLSAIEARGLLWLADDRENLDAHVRGVDPYKSLASTIYNVDYGAVTKAQRQAGKVGTLSSGFSGGSGAVARMAAKLGIDLEAAGTNASAVVEAWRAQHPRVAGFAVSGRTWTDADGQPRLVRRGGLWRELEKAARLAVTEAVASPDDAVVRYFLDGRDLICLLPSGRPIVYRNARVEDMERGGKVRETLVYDSPDRGPKSLYGGLLAENCTQAVCRDVLAEGLLRCEAAGFPVVMHVHDEVVCEVADPAQLADVIRLMEVSPAWAPDWPIKAAGEVGRRYGK